jgi:chromate transporter
MLYFKWSTKVDYAAIIGGILPVVVAYIFSVSYTMFKTTCTRLMHYLVVSMVVITLLITSTYFAILGLLFGSAVLGAIYLNKASALSTKETPRFNNHSFFWMGLICIGIFILTILLSNTIFVQIFKNFALVSLTLLGGGYVMVPLLQDLLINKLQWVNQGEFVYGISIGQMTPGPILISALFFGYKVAGFFGGLLATIGIFFPSAMLMILVSDIYVAFKSNRYVLGAMQLVKPVIVGLIFFSGFSLIMEDSALEKQALVVLLTAFFLFLIIRFKFKPIVLIPLGGILGFIIF